MPDDRDQVETGWNYWDALFLVAIANRSHCDLDILIYESDARIRIYPTEQEASESLGSLIASGLVVAQAPQFEATETGRRIVRRASGPWWRRGRWTMGIIEEVPRIQECLREYPLIEATWTFEAGEVDNAIDRYVRRSSRQ